MKKFIVLLLLLSISITIISCNDTAKDPVETGVESSSVETNSESTTPIHYIDWPDQYFSFSEYDNTIVSRFAGEWNIPHIDYMVFYDDFGVFDDVELFQNKGGKTSNGGTIYYFGKYKTIEIRKNNRYSDWEKVDVEGDLESISNDKSVVYINNDVYYAYSEGHLNAVTWRTYNHDYITVSFSQEGATKYAEMFSRENMPSVIDKYDERIKLSIEIGECEHKWAALPINESERDYYFEESCQFFFGVCYHCTECQGKKYDVIEMLPHKFSDEPNEDNKYECEICEVEYSSKLDAAYDVHLMNEEYNLDKKILIRGEEETLPWDVEDTN